MFRVFSFLFPLLRDMTEYKKSYFAVFIATLIGSLACFAPLFYSRNKNCVYIDNIHLYEDENFENCTIISSALMLYILVDLLLDGVDFFRQFSKGYIPFVILVSSQLATNFIISFFLLPNQYGIALNCIFYFRTVLAPCASFAYLCDYGSPIWSRMHVIILVFSTVSSEITGSISSSVCSSSIRYQLCIVQLIFIGIQIGLFILYSIRWLKYISTQEASSTSTSDNYHCRIFILLLLCLLIGNFITNYFLICNKIGRTNYRNNHTLQLYLSLLFTVVVSFLHSKSNRLQMKLATVSIQHLHAHTHIHPFYINICYDFNISYLLF